MSEVQNYNMKENNKFKNINFSRNNHNLLTQRNAFNNKILKNFINTYNNDNPINLDYIKNQNFPQNTEASAKPLIILNKSNIIKNKSISKFNFNEVLNFNFGQQNNAKLKLINTTMLASPEKKTKSNTTSIKKSPLNKKSINMKLNLEMDLFFIIFDLFSIISGFALASVF